MARRTFFSFHHKPDNWRAAHVRNMGVVAGNRPVSNNGWETVTKGGHTAIEKWISGQMHRCSCTVVLVGSNTAFRKWIDSEIIKSCNEKMGVVGIHIHGLTTLDGKTARKGSNPFAHINYGSAGRKLSSIVTCYTPSGSSSPERYAWIKRHLADCVEEAVWIRNNEG